MIAMRIESDKICYMELKIDKSRVEASRLDPCTCFDKVPVTLEPK